MKMPASTDVIVVDLNVPSDTVFPHNGVVITSLIAGQLERTRLVAPVMVLTCFNAELLVLAFTMFT
ncbi:unnamed protein product, partial [Allacma fusca]